MRIKLNTMYKVMWTLTAISILSCGDKKDTPVASNENILNQKIIVKTTTAGTSDGLESVSVLGIVTSDKEAKPSFKTGGVVAKTYAKEGDKVKKGQLLATLIMSEIDAQVRQAEEGLKKTERDMNRIKNLYADSVATLEQLQNITTAYEVARKSFDIAKFNKQYSEIRSPITGTIVKQIMHDGEIVGPGMPVFAILGTGAADWKISVGLIDRDWARIKINDKGQMVLDAFPGKNYDVYVHEKSVIGGNASSTIDVELKFKNPPQNLAAGLIGKVNLMPNGKSNKTMTLPIEALTKSNGNEAVVYVIENGKAKKASVKIGNILGEKVEIISGISAMQEIVTIGAMYLEDGDLVEVKN
jgi:membrane fusion protein, multidrug efflux system